MKEKNFKFRETFGALVEKMTDKQAGEFIKAVSGYMFGGKPMESKDEYLKGVFLYVQNILDTEMRDRANGKLGGAIVAEKYKEMRSRVMTEETVSESNIVSQLIFVAAGGESDMSENVLSETESETKKRRGRPKTVNVNKRSGYAKENASGGRAE